jgi:hypothetical protein
MEGVKDENVKPQMNCFVFTDGHEMVHLKTVAFSRASAERWTLRVDLLVPLSAEAPGHAGRGMAGTRLRSKLGDSEMCSTSCTSSGLTPCKDSAESLDAQPGIVRGNIFFLI